MESLNSFNQNFQDPQANESFNRNGYVTLDVLGEKEIADLLVLSKKFDAKDLNSYEAGKVAEALTEKNLNEIRDAIKAVVQKGIEQTLSDYRIIRAHFVIKKPNANSFIPAHQDPSLTDEAKHANRTILCWIPLVDTDINNGTLGVLEGSHSTYIGNSPPSPDPRSPRFLDEDIFSLFPYMKYITLKKGEILFFSNRLLHGSLPNFTKNNRIAIRLDLVPKNVPLVHHFLKPSSDAKVIQQYDVDESFFTKYPNEVLVKVYDQEIPPMPYPLIQEFPYFMPDWNLDKFLEELRKHNYPTLFNKRVQKLMEQKDDKIPSSQKKGMLRKFLNLLKVSKT